MIVEPGIGQLVILFLFLLSLSFIALYVYFALVLSSIAKKTNTPKAWLAWIPIANLVLMLQIARVHWAFIFLFLIPWFNVIAFAWVWWELSERRGFPGWYGLLATIPLPLHLILILSLLTAGYALFVLLVFVTNLIFLGVIAWSEPSTKKALTRTQRTEETKKKSGKKASNG